jgi:hypothetical protein
MDAAQAHGVPVKLRPLELSGGVPIEDGTTAAFFGPVQHPAAAVKRDDGSGGCWSRQRRRPAFFELKRARTSGPVSHRSRPASAEPA